jgi:hypothetical protein
MNPAGRIVSPAQGVPPEQYTTFPEAAAISRRQPDLSKGKEA